MTSSSEQIKIPVIKLLLVSMCILALLAIPAGVAASGDVSNRGVTTTTAFTRHWSASAYSFIRNGNWAYNDNCVYGTGILELDRGLELPDHAHITRIELAAVDTNASGDSILSLLVTDLNGNYVSQSIVWSDGESGEGIWGEYVDITVDNFNRLYTISWLNFESAGSTAAFCGVIVTYELPGTLVSLPFVTK